MNIYQCYYQGISGFAGKLDRNHWLFVPDLGQMDNHIHRRLRLSELVFRNRFEYEHELELVSEARFSLSLWIRSLLFPVQEARTTAGLLLLPHSK